MWLARTTLWEHITTGLAVGSVIINVGRGIRHDMPWIDAIECAAAWAITAAWTYLVARSKRAAIEAQDTLVLMDRANKSLVLLLNQRVNPSLRQ